MGLRRIVAPAFLLALGCLYDPVDREDLAQSACEDTRDRLAMEIYAAPQGCTAVLEMDADYELERWALVCGPEEELMIEGSQARRLTECCEEDGTQVNPPDPSDAFVFFDADDNASGVIVVSRHTAQRVFEASLSSGKPDVRFPAEADWRGPSELAVDCMPEEVLDVSSYDEDGDAPPVALVEVLATAKKTGIVDAMRTDDGELLWAIVLRNGAGEPGNGGWVALLQSSSLGIDFTEG